MSVLVVHSGNCPTHVLAISLSPVLCLFLTSSLPHLGFCREPAQEIPPMTSSYGRDLTGKADQDSRDSLNLLEHLPQTKICLSTVYYVMPFTNSSDINRGLSLTTFLGENQLRALVDKSAGPERSISIQTPLLAF